MAFAVLFSTLFFTVESHYCGSNLIDTAVFTKAKSCSGDFTEKTTTKKGCCKNEIDVIKGQDKLKVNSFDDLNFSLQIVFTSHVYSYASLVIGLPKQTVSHQEYVPPNLIYDIQVLDETFLI